MSPPGPGKAVHAFRTIGELAQDTGLPQHVLRYWETKFPQLKPVTRAGNRRYYRPEDVVLVERINALLNHEGYTIRGVQKLLAAEATGMRKAQPSERTGDDFAALRAVRERLAAALDADTP